MAIIRLIVFGLLAASAPASAQQKPNVVFILADNVGYGDLACVSPTCEEHRGSDSARVVVLQRLRVKRRFSPMPTQCSQEELEFGSCGGRKLVGAFDGGAITSNGGVLLLGAADRSIRLTDRLAKCFRDLRLADGITHTIADLLRQRIFSLALGYEDLIDHDQLRQHSSRESRGSATTATS